MGTIAHQPGWSEARVQSIRSQVSAAQRGDRLSMTRRPDLMIDGQLWDILAAETISGVNTLNDDALNAIVQGIWYKGETLQTWRVVYSIDGFREHPNVVRAALRRHLGGIASPFGDNID